uniref:Uncharacterized protein n=1 Tax=Pararge aegeria TaxID=116150 RepID=S4PFR5_9NEOP
MRTCSSLSALSIHTMFLCHGLSFSGVSFTCVLPECSHIFSCKSICVCMCMKSFYVLRSQTLIGLFLFTYAST